jgi:hypothetical protein
MNCEKECLINLQYTVCEHNFAYTVIPRCTCVYVNTAHKAHETISYSHFINLNWFCM